MTWPGVEPATSRSQSRCSNTEPLYGLFLPYISMVAILFIGMELFEQTTIIWTNLVDLESPDSMYQDSASKLSWFWRTFLPYMGMVAILINGPWPFEQIFNLPSTEGSTLTLKKIGPGVSEEKLSPTILLCTSMVNKNYFLSRQKKQT